MMKRVFVQPVQKNVSSALEQDLIFDVAPVEVFAHPGGSEHAWAVD
tara:strand:+ start:358 stop:495 length:138 start_codon:yes stop_codon:yes gene_type:complete